MNEDVVRQLKDLAELHADGLISDDEFAAAKGRVLDAPEATSGTAGPAGAAPAAEPSTSTATPSTPAEGPQASGPPPRADSLQVGSVTISRRNLLLAGAGVVLLLVLVIVISSAVGPTDPKSIAMGTWSCRDDDDGPGRPKEYIIGDGTYEIPSDERRGTWSLDGGTVTINEMEVYGDRYMQGAAMVNLSSGEIPTGGSISYTADYSSGYTYSLQGAGEYDDDTVRIRLRSTTQDFGENITCTKQ